MKNPDKLWYDTCRRFAEQSQCLSRQVGCVIVHENHQISQGWNGAPEGSCTSNCPRAKCQSNTGKSGDELDLAICSHAEINAIGYCSRHGISTRGSTLYCTTVPCYYCAGAIIASGIEEVVYDVDYPGSESSKKAFVNAKVKCRKFFT